MLDNIPCKFVPMKKSKYTESEAEKCGRYTQCSYTIPGYGVSNWVVVAYLEVDYKKYYNQGISEEDLIEGCARYLSLPPPRKKYQKKKPRSLYGELKPVPANWKGRGSYVISEKKGYDNRLIVEFIIDERRNKQFWDEGIAAFDMSNVKKPGRKKKESIL